LDLVEGLLSDILVTSQTSVRRVAVSAASQLVGELVDHVLEMDTRIAGGMCCLFLGGSSLTRTALSI